MKVLESLPSPAMLIALIALFVSLGGVSYGLAAGSIGSREIKKRIAARQGHPQRHPWRRRYQ